MAKAKAVYQKGRMRRMKGLLFQIERAALKDTFYRVSQKYCDKVPLFKIVNPGPILLILDSYQI
jgi:hypothetical protein